MDISPPCDTICAVATAIGEAGIGIVKLSGPEALTIGMSLFRPARPCPEWVSHHLYYGWIRDPVSETAVDEVLFSYMQGPRSYTGEDVVEINCHSGYAVLNKILELVLGRGARLAEPGEFTRRAFLNGRIDLTQAEAVIEVIRSRSDAGLALANRQLRGELRDRIARWRRTLLDLQADLEVELDFSEDLDDQPEPLDGIKKIVDRELIRPMAELVRCYRQHRVLREGLSLVLIGKPNVGKSSLLNQLIGRDRAIVTATPGTTRDVIEDSFLLAGIQVRILDTAGIRRQASAIEALGIERTLDSLEEADLAVWMLDGSQPLAPEDDLISRHLEGKPHIIVLNKSDLAAALSEDQVHRRYPSSLGLISMCALDPVAIDRFKEFLRAKALPGASLAGQSLFIPNWRQHQCLVQCVEALHRASRLITDHAYPELVSAELELARKQLDTLLGLNLDGELLDQVFSRFCIGK